MEWNGKYIKYSEQDGIAIVTLDNPPVNALCQALVLELEDIFLKIRQLKEIAVIIITGAGNRAFTAGSDIKELLELNSQTGGKAFSKVQEVFTLIENFTLPVIGAINGYAFGAGFELLLSTDIRIATKETKVGTTGVNLGICFNTQRLPRIIGINLAKEMIFTGATITALKAKNIGIINRVVPANELMDYSIKIAKLIISKGPLAVRAAKTAINEGINVSIGEGIKIENAQLSKMFDTEDQKEGVKAFFEKRAPNFQGK